MVMTRLMKAGSERVFPRKFGVVKMVFGTSISPSALKQAGGVELLPWSWLIGSGLTDP
jgi:hypothetical protein